MCRSTWWYSNVCGANLKNALRSGGFLNEIHSRTGRSNRQTGFRLIVPKVKYVQDFLWKIYSLIIGVGNGTAGLKSFWEKSSHHGVCRIRSEAPVERAQENEHIYRMYGTSKYFLSNRGCTMRMYISYVRYWKYSLDTFPGPCTYSGVTLPYINLFQFSISD